jgi:hypothetical protein
MPNSASAVIAPTPLSRDDNKVSSVRRGRYDAQQARETVVKRGVKEGLRLVVVAALAFAAGAGAQESGSLQQRLRWVGLYGKLLAAEEKLRGLEAAVPAAPRLERTDWHAEHAAEHRELRDETFALEDEVRQEMQRYPELLDQQYLNLMARNVTDRACGLVLIDSLIAKGRYSVVDTIDFIDPERPKWRNSELIGQAEERTLRRGSTASFPADETDPEPWGKWYLSPVTGRPAEWFSLDYGASKTNETHQ